MRQSVNETLGKEGAANYRHEYTEKNVRNSIDDIGISAKLKFSISNNQTLLLGANYVNHRFSPEKVLDKTSNSLVQMDSINIDDRIYANELGAYIEDDISLSSRFRVNIGMHAANFNVRGKSYFTVEPRISTRFMLSPTLSVKTAYSRMSQFVQQVNDSYISLPTDFWMPISEMFKPLTSDQISAGLYYSRKNEYTFSIEGYYKWMDNLLEYKDGYNLLPSSVRWDSKLTVGSGTAYGIDMTVEKNLGRLKGFVGYGLMWTNRHFDEINMGRSFPSKYDNRHKVNISLSYQVRENMELNAGWTYMTGNRVTLSLENYQDLPSAGFPSTSAPSYPYNDTWGVNYYESKNNVRLPAYHRLDLGINIYCPKKNGHMGIWNISVYNAYCRMNPIVIQKSTQKMTTSGVAMNPKFQSLAIFPIIPSISYTYKF